MEISVDLIKSPRQGSDSQIAQSTFPHNKQDMRTNENSQLPEGSGGVAALNTQGQERGQLDTGGHMRVISVQADRGRDDRTEHKTVTTKLDRC